MVLIFIILAWLAVLSLVVGMCMAASMGDRDREQPRARRFVARREATAHRPARVPQDMHARTAERKLAHAGHEAA